MNRIIKIFLLAVSYQLIAISLPAQLRAPGLYTTTATAAGTTTLTVSSTRLQFFTGSTTQTVVLPVVSTLSLGHEFVIVNNSTGLVTINSSGGNQVAVLAQATTVTINCVLITGTGAASWNPVYNPVNSAAGKKATFNNTLNFSGTDGKGIDIGGATAGSVLVGDGSNVGLVNQRTNWTSFAVTGSNATTTGQTLVDVTGLTSGTLLNNTLYEIEAWLNVTTSAVTTGCQYAITAGGSGSVAVVQAMLIGNSTGTTITIENIVAPATASSARLLTSAQSGMMYIHGWVTTRSTGTANISIQHLKNTSGTSTVLIGSKMLIRVANGFAWWYYIIFYIIAAVLTKLEKVYKNKMYNMKKIVSVINLLIVAGVIHAQIDTVMIRNLSLKKETWGIVATIFPTTDSLESETERKIFNVMKDFKNSPNSTQINFDSLPGRIGRFLYNRMKNLAYLIPDKLGNEFFQKLAAYPPLAPFIALEDTNNTNQFNDQRDLGYQRWFRLKRN